MFCPAMDMSLKTVNHLSLNNHFVLLLKLLVSTENKLKRKHGHSHREKVGSLCQKCKRKWITFFKKKKPKPLNKSQNISLRQVQKK